MLADEIKINYINGPTALFEAAGLRFLTDPTFDPKDTDFVLPHTTLRKITDPAAGIDKIGNVDFVLLSHDHHPDNLDKSGKQLLSSVKAVYTTQAGAERLGGNSAGLKNWETVEITAPNGKIITITGTPCQHGPAGGDRGPVVGFVLNYKNETDGAVYISGDTVMFDGVKEVAIRFNIKLAVLFMGAAKIKAAGPHHLTMTAAEGVEAARLFDKAQIIPLHFEGWEHFSESRKQIEEEFNKAGLSGRLQWAEKI